MYMIRRGSGRERKRERQGDIQMEKERGKESDREGNLGLKERGEEG